jgi:nitrate reductase NapAB chaperone NapD
MAIMGFLAHAGAESCDALEKHLAAMPGINTYGIHKGCYIVAVAEAPHTELEALLGRVSVLPGMLSCSVTSLTLEDEQ